MKKVLLFSIVVLSMLSSCSKDEDDSLGVSQIVGNWNSIYLEEYDYDSGEFIWEGKSSQVSFKLYDDGTCLYGSAKGTYKLIGKELDLFVTYPKTEFLGETNITYNYVIDKFSKNNMTVRTDSRFTDGSHIIFVYTMERVN